MFSLDGLNKNQRLAAETINGPVLILAGAGSGKTRTITFRIAHMIENLKIDPSTILGVSFTNKAACEMKERVEKLTNAKGITLSTFHSLGVQILKKEIDKLGYQRNFSIYDTGDQRSIIREALRYYKAEKKFDQKVILSKIGLLKNNGIDENAFTGSRFFDYEDPYDLACEFCYRFYQEKLRFFNAIDFDDILHLTLKLFKEHPQIAKKYSERFRYIMIDEYQDTNPLQFQIVLGLTSTHHNLCVVGDDDQSIYAFRGADISNILNFETHFKGAKVIKLEENYRSTMPILELANQVIKGNKKRKEKNLWSQNRSTLKPLVWSMGDSTHEAQTVVEEIRNLIKKGTSPRNIAILYRGKNQAPPIEEQLRLNNLPYAIIGGQKLYDKKEIKDLMGYLCVILNPNDELSLRRIINIPHRGIGTTTLGKYIAKSQENSISIFKAFENYPLLDPKRENHIRSFSALIRKYQKLFHVRPLAQALQALIEELNFFDFITKQYTDTPKQAEMKQNDVMHFIATAERYQSYSHDPSLRNFIEDLLLKDSQDKEEENDQIKEEVTMMTLHSSKGLEFDHIYLVGMEEELLPHKKTINEGEDIDEERRLCYVGITRAKKCLTMTYCKERLLFGKKVPRKRSRFLHGLDEYFTHQDRTTFNHLSPEEASDYKKSFISNLMGMLDD